MRTGKEVIVAGTTEIISCIVREFVQAVQKILTSLFKGAKELVAVLTKSMGMTIITLLQELLKAFTTSVVICIVALGLACWILGLGCWAMKD